MKCPQCGSTDFDEDRARADVICLGCGFVVGENAISSEVEFIETSAGAAAAVGRFVSDESQLNEVKSSRAVTEANARKRIETICGQLRLSGDVVTSAFRFYQSALFRGLTKGKTSLRLAAACVYLAARQLKVNLMLLDLSDAVAINVYALSNTFTELKRKLNLVIPEFDPCLLLERFASQLEFGDKTLAVSTTAMRLLQRMQKDWISVGRRPNGLCAAALLVAARIHEFNRTEEDVCRVARIGLHTTKKRLDEFSKTASSALTIEDFFNVDYEEEEDPPAFTESMRKAELVSEIDAKKMETLSAEIKELGKRIDTELEELSAKKFSKGYWGSLSKLGFEKSKGLDHLIKDDVPSTSFESSNDTSEPITLEKMLNREMLRNVLDGVIEPDLLETCADDLHLVTSCSGENLCDLVSSIEQLRDYQDEVTSSVNEPDIKQELKTFVDTKTDLKLPVLLPSAKFSADNTLPDLPIDTILKTDDIDDKEIENEYLLNQREIMIKAVVWVKDNADFLEKRRKVRAEKRRLEAENKPKPRKHRNLAQSHAKADKIIDKINSDYDAKLRSKQSKKINYEALDGLISGSTVSNTQQLISNSRDCHDSTPERVKPIVGPLLAATLIREKPVMPPSTSEEIQEPYESETEELCYDDDQEDYNDEDWQNGTELW